LEGIGIKLREARTRWKLSLREVEERSSQLAAQWQNPAYGISRGDRKAAFPDAAQHWIRADKELQFSYLPLDRGQDVTQVVRLQIQLEQVIDVRFRPAEFENSLQLIDIPHPVDLLTDLVPGDRKRGGTARTTGKTATTASFHWCSSHIVDISSI
jgi:hypothetical protein